VVKHDSSICIVLAHAILLAFGADCIAGKEGCYFKAGCYTQSNTDKGDTPKSCGEVVMYGLEVTHERPAAGDGPIGAGKERAK